MFSYRKRVIFPIHIDHPDEKFAAALIGNFQGPDSKLSAFTRLMYHRLHMDHPNGRDLLGMIAAEELGHWELIGNVALKLGLSDLPPGNFRGDNNVESDLKKDESIIHMLIRDEEAEARARKKLSKLLELTNDVYLQKMIRFLEGRDSVHQSLIRKTIVFVSQNAGNAQFSALIHEYRMSMRVIG